MPQQSLLPEHPAMTSLAVEVRSYPLTPSPDVVQILVKVGVGSAALKARWAGTLTGVERDYLDTLCETITATFMYGETPRDIARACADVKRLARKHAANHEF